MRPDRVVLTTPPLDQHLRLLERVEDLTGEQFVSKFAVEALAVTVLPRRTRFDEERLHTDTLQPVSHDLGRKLRPVVRPDVLGHATRNEQPGQSLKYVVALERSSDVDRQALARVLIDDRQHAEATTVIRPSLYEVIRPDVIAPLGPQPHA